MPFASFIKVREVSSEDNICLAENLIKSHATRGWRTKNVGEKSAYVILEMSESHQIVGIDIGNDHSAFVEVLVGKSTCASENFKEILVTSSFMTPIESKSSNNINRVRCFSKNALVPNVVDGKWSLVKIVCMQPFNKHVQYGISFIKLHVQENLNPKSLETDRPLLSDRFLSQNKETKTGVDKVVSKFRFRENSPESTSNDSTSLYSRWKKFKDEKVSTAQSTNKDKEPDVQVPFSEAKQVNKTCSSIRDGNRDGLCFSDESLNISNNNAKLSDNGKHRVRLETKNSSQNEANSIYNKSLETFCSNDTTDCSDVNLKLTKKRENSPPPENKAKKRKSSTKYAPFNQLLKGVVFVISGIQNPERGNLREKALAMGAKYKGDWGTTCTHLICAFKNTPKYNQVKGKGKIVTPSWIDNCYSLKKYLPWRRYALETIELAKEESDEEIVAEPSQSHSGKHLSESDSGGETIALYDVDEFQSNSMTVEKILSDCDTDTDDEIKKVVEGAKNNKKDLYDASTDEEDYLREKYKQL